MAPGVEFSDLNWISIIIAIVVNIVVGFVWYAPFTPTGKLWMRHQNMPANFKPSGKQMTISMILAVIGAFLVMFVMQHDFVAYRDAYRLDQAGYDLTLMDGVMGGFFTWLGFFVPIYLGFVAWENKPWSLYFVNVGYWFVVLVTAGIIFATMGLN